MAPKTIFALAIAGLILVAVLGRWTVVPVPTGGDEGKAVLLDRWTGTTRPVWTDPTLAYVVGDGYLHWPGVLPDGFSFGNKTDPSSETNTPPPSNQ